jgi:hypothetical protein
MRRGRTVRRASAGYSRVRAGAGLVAVIAAAAIYGVANSSAFQYTHLRIDPSPVYTDPAAVESALAGVRGENLFRIDTDPLEAALESLRTVDSARVSVQLPDTLAVALREREPILVWVVGDRRFLVDADGSLFAEAGAAGSGDAADLPVVDDRRAASAGLVVGTTLAAVDLDAATRLASLVPEDIASAAGGLTVSLTDENGFVLRTTPASWNAIFGFYTPSLRTPEGIPGQVRLLRCLLTGREATVDRVILASDTDGTYIPNATPTPDPSASPTTTPSPSTSPDTSCAP